MCYFLVILWDISEYTIAPCYLFLFIIKEHELALASLRTLVCEAQECRGSRLALSVQLPGQPNVQVPPPSKAGWLSEDLKAFPSWGGYGQPERKPFQSSSRATGIWYGLNLDQPLLLSFSLTFHEKIQLKFNPNLSRMDCIFQFWIHSFRTKLPKVVFGRYIFILQGIMHFQQI